MTEASRVFSARRGSAIITVMITVTLSALVLMALFDRLIDHRRQVEEALTRDRCRLVAQTVLEQAKNDLVDGFNSYLALNADTVRFHPTTAPGYDWFNTIGGDWRTIGSASPVMLLSNAGNSYFPVHIGGRDYRAWLGIGRYREHAAGATRAVIPLAVTVESRLSRGRPLRYTRLERVCFDYAQSRVFDSAVCVNNSLYLSGNYRINGDLHANGDIYFANGVTMNGFVSAAANPGIGAEGRLRGTAATVRDRSGYRSQASTRSRFDRGNGDLVGVYFSPGSGGAISTTLKTLEDFPRPIVTERDALLAFPCLANETFLQTYINQNKGTLSYPASTYVDGTGKPRGTPAGSFTASYAGNGPSREPWWYDKGALLLVGTASSPIRINGPVWVAEDVIIRGYVTGRGTIYSGRNVHIIGSIEYVNPPIYSHTASEEQAKTQLATADTRDALALVARGNIIFGYGDATDRAIDDFVSDHAHAYACDANETDIGYQTSFNGDYRAVEPVGQRCKVRQGAQDGVVVQALDRRYCETVCDDRAITDNLQPITRVDAVLMSGHGIFGALDANCQLLGALATRDLGIQAPGGAEINWDMRLRRETASTTSEEVRKKLSLPPGPQEPYVLSFVEGPTALNPAFSEPQE